MSQPLCLIFLIIILSGHKMFVGSAYCSFPSYLWQESSKPSTGIEAASTNDHQPPSNKPGMPGKLWYSHVTLKSNKNSEFHSEDDSNEDSDYGFQSNKYLSSPATQYYYNNPPIRVGDYGVDGQLENQWSENNGNEDDDDDRRSSSKKRHSQIKRNSTDFLNEINFKSSDNSSQTIKHETNTNNNIRYRRSYDQDNTNNYKHNNNNNNNNHFSHNGMSSNLDLSDPRPLTSDSTRFPTILSSYREILVEPTQIMVKLVNMITCHDISANRSSACFSKQEIQEISCLSEEVNEKYRVRIKSDGESKFGCVRFIRSWPNVVQVYLAQPKKINDARLCLDPFIKRNAHPWISGRKETWSFCPFSGGFDFRIYLTGRRKPLCGKSRNHWRPSRMESECITGEGMNFIFQDSKCNFLPPELNGSMLSCWGSFIEGASTYVFFGGVNQPRPQYTMRLPSNPVQSKEMWATLYFSIYAPDPAILPTWNLEEALVDSNRDELTFPMDADETELKQVDFHMIKSDGGVCYDESDFCSEFAKEGKCVNTALHKFANFCKKSCGLCGHKADLVPSTNSECHFPMEYRGRWLLVETDHMEEVVVEEGKVIFSRLGSFICKSKHWKKEQYKVFSVYHNGCRPRYSCIHFRQEEKLLYFQISRSSLFDNSFDLCIFKDDEESLKDAIRSKKLKMLIAHNDLKYDKCDLKGSVKIGITFQDLQPSGKISQRKSCNGTMSDSDLPKCQYSNLLTVHVPNCPHCRDEIIYQCVGSVDISDTIKILITKLEQSFTCWIIYTNPERTSNRPWRSVFVMDRGQCGHLKDLTVQRTPNNVAMTIVTFSEHQQVPKCLKPHSVNPSNHNKQKNTKKSSKTFNTTTIILSAVVQAPKYNLESALNNLINAEFYSTLGVYDSNPEHSLYSEYVESCCCCCCYSWNNWFALLLMLIHTIVAMNWFSCHFVM